MIITKEQQQQLERIRIRGQELGEEFFAIWLHKHYGIDAEKALKELRKKT